MLVILHAGSLSRNNMMYKRYRKLATNPYYIYSTYMVHYGTLIQPIHLCSIYMAAGDCKTI